jgi:hypothetical protein
MSVIFQLFCAEDLKKLTKLQLEGLREAVGTALRNYFGSAPEAPLFLSLKVSHRTDLPQQAPDKVDEALKKRFREVSHQLESPQLQPPERSFNFETFKEARRSPTKIEQEELILQWAITCEVENYAFYLPLLHAKKVAYDYFDAEIRKNMEFKGQNPPKEKILPIGPDSLYSPFNRRHPLYNLFYDLNL